MRDKLEGVAASSGTSRSPEKERAARKPRRMSERPTVTDDLTGKFLRVGNDLYRSTADKKPFATLHPDRVKADSVDALPDIVRIAKANGWTSIRINGGVPSRERRRACRADLNTES